MEHHTKDKGDIGVAVIIADLYKKGLKVLTPMSEHLPFDIVAYDPASDDFYKVQCKYSKLSNKNTVYVKLVTSYATQHGSFSSRYKKNSFDVIATYCPEMSSVYYISSEFADTYKSGITLRTESASNKQEVSVNYAKDFIKFPRR